MNWIGAILLIVATTSIGFERALRLKRRPEQLLELKTALQIMEAEIVYSQREIVDVCAQISKHIRPPLKAFFYAISSQLNKNDDLSLLWEQELDELKSHSALENEEINIMKQFGHTLGHFDIIQQQKQIQLTSIHLDRLLKEADRDYLTLSKVYRGVGILTGILIALILM